MSVGVHSSGKNSFYSNLKRLFEFYNLADFDPVFLTDAKIKHYVNLMQQKHILYCQRTIQHYTKLEFYNNCKERPYAFLLSDLDLTKKSSVLNTQTLGTSFTGR